MSQVENFKPLTFRNAPRTIAQWIASGPTGRSLDVNGETLTPKNLPSESSCIYFITAFSCSCCFHSDLFIISIAFRIFHFCGCFFLIRFGCFGCWKLDFRLRLSRGSTPAAASLVVPAPSPDTVASNRREANWPTEGSLGGKREMILL